MNPMVDKGRLAGPVPLGWPFIFCLIALLAAALFTPPVAQAANVTCSIGDPGAVTVDTPTTFTATVGGGTPPYRASWSFSRANPRKVSTRNVQPGDTDATTTFYRTGNQTAKLTVTDRRRKRCSTTRSVAVSDASSVSLSGTVTNSLTGQGVAGATITLTATSATIVLTTDASGHYSDNTQVQVGTYAMDVTAANFNDSSQSLSLLQGATVVDVALQPVAPVIVSASVGGGKLPGEALPATGSYLILDGSTYISSSWSQTPDEGVPALISDPSSDTPTVTLGSASEYAAHLVQVLREPPITEADLPPDVILQPINEIEKGLQDRNQVVAINPFGFEKAEEVPLQYSVTTTSGTYSVAVNVLTELPWVVNPGVKTVPVNVPVLLFAKDGTAGYSWTLTGPGSSSATLVDADTQTPWFTPDVVGTYHVQETNGSGADLEVHAGRYHGVIDPLLTVDSVEFGDGRPVADENCTSCHYEGGPAPDNFTTWRQTGHAEAFSQGINTNSHFGENCFACHSVGYQRDNAGGIDNTPNYDDFVNTLLGQTGPDTWETMLINYPDTARLANIQCENCHGPQDYTNAHRDQPGAPRVSLAADVCGSCHGEPARHGRFQQWQLSNHADYDLARERGASSGNCARCHSGNGFVAWSRLDFDPDQQVNVTWDEDTVQPQVCAACHNPHDTGTTSGTDETDAKVRVMGNTHQLLAGFTAIGVGKGATCMTCHNSRAGVLHNDNTWDTLTDSEKTGSPHHGVQADLIMGQNVYFVQPGIRGKHSLIEDVCVTCHMNKTQPPDILSYNQTGTNHTFAADPNICAECHGAGGVTADTVQTVITAYLDLLQEGLSDSYKALMEDHYPVNIGSTCGVADATNPIVDVNWAFSRGVRLGITLQDGASCTNVQASGITVDDGMPAAQSLVALTLVTDNGNLVKAGWNWSIFSEDEGKGVHNPDLSLRALQGAISAVSAGGVSVNSIAVPTGFGVINSVNQ